MILSESQRAMLDEVHYAVVGTLNRNGTIQQTVVWFLREGEEIRFGAMDSAVKVRNLRRHPAITLTVADKGRYLTVSGRAVVEPADPELRYRLALRYLGADRADAWVKQRPDAERVSVRMIIDHAYGQGV